MPGENGRHKFKDPVAIFRFGVEIKGILNGWFSECNGLSIQRDVFPVKEGGTNDFVHKLPGRITYSNLTLKRGIAGDELWHWFAKGLTTGQIERISLSILLFNNDRTQARRWDLREAYPIKWSGPDLKTDSTQIAIETVELAHHGWEMSGWSAS